MRFFAGKICIVKRFLASCYSAMLFIVVSLVNMKTGNRQKGKPPKFVLDHNSRPMSGSRAKLHYTKAAGIMVALVMSCMSTGRHF